MKIIAFSDLHRDKRATEIILEASADADILVGAGDFATQGKGLGDCIEILRRATIPVILVPGNHESHRDLVALCEDSKNLHVLHGEGMTIAGTTFFGLGGEIPARNDARWNQTLPEESAQRIFEGAGDYDILVTHTPPFQCADLQRNGSHEGSLAIAEALRKTQPALHLCGHIHYSWGAFGNVGETYVRNLGPTVNWFENGRPIL